MMDIFYELDHVHLPQIGLIVLQSDETIERDMAWLLPANAELLVTRVPSGTSVTPESLQAMQDALTGAAALLPRGAAFAAVGYGCTSGTAQIGPGQISNLVHAGVATRVVTEPVSALIAACASLEVSRLGLISPYIASVSDRLRNVVANADIEITRFASFNEPLEQNVVRISPASIAQAAKDIGRDSACDAVFLSCTNLRTLDVIDDIEQAIGKPVFSSNQVLAWHLGRLAKLDTPQFAPGRLFTGPKGTAKLHC